MAYVLGNQTLEDQLIQADDEENVFAHLSSGIADKAENTVSRMLSGEAYAPARERLNEALVRAAQQQRAKAGALAAPNLGQGSAIRSQQAVEQQIFSGVAEMQLKMAEAEQAMKERGVTAAMALEQVGRTNWMDRYKAMQDLIAQGGEENYAQAQAMWEKLLPGTNIDFSRALAAENRADFEAGMSFVSKLVESGVSKQDAIQLAQQQGIISRMGVDEQQFDKLYENALVQGNPIAATIHAFRTAVETGDITKELADEMTEAFMESKTGLDVEVDPQTGKIRFVPFDGFKKVNDLLDVVPGQSVKLMYDGVTEDGVPIPAGRYRIIKTEQSTKDANYWTGKKTTTKVTSVIAWNADTGKKYVLRTEESTTVDDESYLGAQEMLTMDWLF